MTTNKTKQKNLKNQKTKPEKKIFLKNKKDNKPKQK